MKSTLGGCVSALQPLLRYCEAAAAVLQALFSLPPNQISAAWQAHSCLALLEHYGNFLGILDSNSASNNVINNAINNELRSQIAEGTGDSGVARFRRVDVKSKDNLHKWLLAHQSSFRPTTIRLSKASKDLSNTSIHPTLGKDSTLPQNRPNKKNPAFEPAQYQYLVWYFFYGTLANTESLDHILGILHRAEMPVLRSSSMVDGAIKSWQGKYKALVDTPGSHADGWSYQVTSEDQEEALLIYETENYEIVRCNIKLSSTGAEMEQVVQGCTFRLAGPSLGLQP